VSIISLDDLRAWAAANTDTANDVQLEASRASAEASVVRFCGRSFDKDSTATTRKFSPDSATNAWVDDFWTTTDLVVATDDNDDGTAEITWATTDYELHPLNGRIAGETVPYFRIEAVESRYFCRSNRRPVLHLTAKWGWAAVPEPVTVATLMQASADYARRTSPHGVAAFGEFGPIRVRSTIDPRAAELLTPYRHPRVALGFA